MKGKQERIAPLMETMYQYSAHNSLTLNTTESY